MWELKAEKIIVGLFMIILYVVCPCSNQKPHFHDWCTRIKRLNLYILLWLNESNLKLIFTCLQIQISQLNNQQSQSYSRLSALAVFLCPVWFSPYWLKERDSKIWQINNEIFYTISWDSSQIYGCTLRDIMMQKCWARNKTISPFLLQWSTISIYSHCISSHNMFFRPKAINLKISICKTTPDTTYTLLAFCSSSRVSLISHMNGSQHVLT